MAITKRKHGSKTEYRFDVFYTAPDGSRKRKSSKWFATKKEAASEEKRFLTAPIQAESKKGKCFSALMAEWIEVSGRDNTTNTKDDKRRILNLYCQSLMDKSVFSITPADIKEIFEDPHFISLSSYRKNKLYTDLNGCFEYACIQWGLERNPMKGFPRYKETTEEKLAEVEILDKEQFNQLLEAIPKKHWIYRNLFFFLYWTGMRANEALSLTFADISNHRAKVWRQWDKKEGWRLLKTKGSVRSVQLDPDLDQIVQEQLAYYERFKGFSKDWFIFGGPRHLSYTTVQRVKNDALKETGLPHVKIHSFRHSHASNLIAAGVPVIKISKRLGHSSVTMTQDIYGHLIENDDDDILNAMRHK